MPKQSTRLLDQPEFRFGELHYLTFRQVMADMPSTKVLYDAHSHISTLLSDKGSPALIEMIWPTSDDCCRWIARYIDAYGVDVRKVPDFKVTVAQMSYFLEKQLEALLAAAEG